MCINLLIVLHDVFNVLYVNDVNDDYYDDVDVVQHVNFFFTHFLEGNICCIAVDDIVDYKNRNNIY